MNISNVVNFILDLNYSEKIIYERATKLTQIVYMLIAQ